MAEHHSHPVVDNDYAEHEKTYVLFLSLMKWGTIATLLLLVFIGSMTGILPWWLTFLIAIGLFAASTVV
mgnify:CR=1 FL=1